MVFNQRLNTQTGFFHILWTFQFLRSLLLLGLCTPPSQAPSFTTQQHTANDVCTAQLHGALKAMESYLL